MPFIDRHPDGLISGIFIHSQRPGHEYVTDDDPIMVAWLAARQAERDAEDADKLDRASLRRQLLDATEAQWLALTETQRQKVILKALKYVARNL
jgi:hypothetical protein